MTLIPFPVVAWDLMDDGRGVVQIEDKTVWVFAFAPPGPRPIGTVSEEKDAQIELALEARP